MYISVIRKKVCYSKKEIFIFITGILTMRDIHLISVGNCAANHYRQWMSFRQQGT